MEEKKEISLFFEFGNGLTLCQKVPKGQKIKDVKPCVEQIKEAYAFLVDGELHSKDYQLLEDCRCEAIYYNSVEGYRMYTRTLKFLLFMAGKIAFPRGNIKIGNKKGNNFDIELIDIPLQEKSVNQIKDIMILLVKKNLKITKQKVSYRELCNIYSSNNMSSQLDFYSLNLHDSYTVNQCDGFYNYMYGKLLESTGRVNNFDLTFNVENKEVTLVLPLRNNIKELSPTICSDKIHQTFKEFDKIASKIGVSTVSQLNRCALDDGIKDVISFFEKEQISRLKEIADIVKKRKIDIIFLSGPSSSGKTTLSQKLAKQLKRSEIFAYPISMDDYFFEPKDSPVDENGKKDFESVSHFDKEFFREDVLKLLKGEEVIIPHYNFSLGGKREFFDKNKLKLKENDVLIIEGIHALNPCVYDFLDGYNVFKIYAAPLITLEYDLYTKVSSNDTRLLRRIVRDSQTRNTSIEQTFEKWEQVKKGEEKNIFPFVEQADYIYNTSLIYEIGVMKLFVENLLLKVPSTSIWYFEARRLYSMLQNFRSIFTSYIPKDSIIREFIGSGCFKR